MSWRPEDRPIYDPEFWKERLDDAVQRGNLWESVYKTDKDTWARIEAKEREVLARYIEPTHSVMDIGCGYGRLLDLMPKDWRGAYLGIDIATDFILLARKRYPGREFLVYDLRQTVTSPHPYKYDWGVTVSVARVIAGHSGQAVWDEIQERLLRTWCKRLLILDLDPADEGIVVP